MLYTLPWCEQCSKSSCELLYLATELGPEATSLSEDMPQPALGFELSDSPLSPKKLRLLPLPLKELLPSTMLVEGGCTSASEALPLLPCKPRAPCQLNNRVCSSLHWNTPEAGSRACSSCTVSFAGASNDMTVCKHCMLNSQRVAWDYLHDIPLA